MKIIEVLSQSRRDFTATIECESCKKTKKLTSGYDDGYYHSVVIPGMKCEHCGESRNSLKEKGFFGDRIPEGSSPSVPSWVVI